MAGQRLQVELIGGLGRHAGGYVGACSGEGSDRPGGQRERYGKHRTADPARGRRSRHERQGHEPLQGERGEHRERPRDRRPDDDIGVSAVSLMARLVNLHSWRCKRFEGYLPASLNTCGTMLRTAVLASDPVGSKQEPPVLRSPAGVFPRHPDLQGRGQAILQPGENQKSDATGRRRVGSGGSQPGCASALPQAPEWPEQAVRRDRRGNAYRYAGEESDAAFPGGAILPRLGPPELTRPAAFNSAVAQFSSNPIGERQRHILRALRLPLWSNSEVQTRNPQVRFALETDIVSRTC